MTKREMIWLLRLAQQKCAEIEAAAKIDEYAYAQRMDICRQLGKWPAELANVAGRTADQLEAKREGVVVDHLIFIPDLKFSLFEDKGP